MPPEYLLNEAYDFYRPAPEILPIAIPMKYVTSPSTAPTKVISSPLAHHERIVIRDLAAPTAKWANRETTAATITAG
jgi:hypothetical protein